MPRATSYREHLERWLGPGLIVLTFALLTSYTWRRWPDPLIDFGHELYTPWRLASGGVLYRDEPSLFGPLSQYLNAGLFRLFGVSLTTIISCNLVILAGLTGLLYRMFADVCDRLTATVAALVLLTVFGFSQYTRVGNYNYVCPYAHEATHGVVLAVAMVYAVHRFLNRGGMKWAGLAGLCLGLVGLTKPETAMAAGASMLVAVGLMFWARSQERTRQGKVVVCVLCGALVPHVIFIAYFLTRLPPRAAVLAVLRAWTSLLPLGRVAAPAGPTANVSGASWVPGGMFYEEITGLGDPAVNVLRMCGLTAWIVLFGAIAGALDIGSHATRRRYFLACAASSGVLLAVFLFEKLPWLEAGRPLPVLALLTLGLIWIRLRQERDDWEAVARLIPVAMWGAFASVMLAKTALHARLYHYGFYLAMPATLLLVICGLWLMPRLLARAGGRGTLFRCVSITAIVVGVLYHLNWSHANYRLKNFEVGTGADAFLTFDKAVSPVGPVVEQSLQWIEQHVPAGATMAALPEGEMLNYLSRRINPLPVVKFTEDPDPDFLTALEAHPPDFILLVARNMREYGHGSFGVDPGFGKRLMALVDRHYKAVALMGADPIRPGQFGIKVLQQVR